MKNTPITIYGRGRELKLAARPPACFISHEKPEILKQQQPKEKTLTQITLQNSTGVSRSANGAHFLGEREGRQRLVKLGVKSGFRGLGQLMGGHPQLALCGFLFLSEYVLL